MIAANDPALSDGVATDQPTTAESDTKGSPFHQAAAEYLAAGWSPFPLPRKKKSPPPAGFTGYAGAFTTPDAVAAWKKGKGGNVGLRMPQCVLGIDVDNYGDKNGGATFADAVARLGALPPTWRSTSRHADPVSGIRYFRVPEGRQWADRLGGDVEIVHHGHRYAVAAPSVHPEGGEYGWYDADGLPSWDCPTVDDLPALPATWVAELDAGDVGDRPAKVSLSESDAGEWLSGLPAGEPCPPVAEVVDGAEKAFSNGSRHDTARGLVLRLVRLGEQGHTGTLAALDALEDLWLAALHDRQPGWGEWERMVSGGVAMALATPTPDADRGCCAPVDETGDKLALSVRLRRHVEEHYDAFPAGGDGRIFVQSKKGGRAELLTRNFVIRAAGHLDEKAASLSKSATEAATVLTARALHEHTRALALRAHYQPGRIVVDLAQTNSTRCVVVTPDGWTVEDVPPRDVVFQTAGAPLPTPARGGDVDELRRLLRWQPDDPRWLLVKGWLTCSLLADQNRPILCLFGPQGSHKSTTGRFLTGVFDPKPKGVLGGGFGKDRSDDETKALKHYVPAWDNVSKLSDEGADFLSRLVTGDLIEKRMLYSDADLVSISYRRTAVITGINMPRGVKPDTLDRLILVALQREGVELTEGELDAEWATVQPRVLAGVLDLAAQMLAGLPTAQNPAGLRMADYAQALWAIDPALYDAYRDNVTNARGDMAHDDPFIRVLVSWLRSCDGGEWEGTAEEAQQEGIVRADFDGAWWPSDGRTLSEQLNKCSELLRVVGVTVTERRSVGRKLKRFVLAEK